jgi:hypothetical protein
MNIATLTNGNRRELAQRTNGGLEITLYWHPDTNRTSIDVHDRGIDETISFPVPAGRALDAFHHPFVFLSTRYERGLRSDHFVPSRN